MKLCPHRGHPLLENGKCPYHGVCYPSNPFVTLKEEYALMDPGEIGRIVGNFGELFFFNEMEVHARYSLWMQNTADVNHLAAVHGDGFNKLFETGDPYDLQFSADKTQSSYKLKVAPQIVERYRRLCVGELNDYFYHLLMFPSCSITSFLGAFYSLEAALALPGGKRCWVRTTFMTSNSVKVPETVLIAARIANKRILLEDKAIIESWNKTEKITNNWLPNEERIKVYCDLMEGRKL